ncbi:DUF4326 domain-containing protein [Ancylobacter polymorphus]|uniref:Uncharacterized protein n=1 Tax=Ancylobacter polymorphus TaxID=223390 RepID=A0ABU0BHG8_9HYPH|nr:DUF4326 domain-containing protein [Ancylobacter polymorphus]MDQ0305285.1 hypothetical protein [Ancylobacter polymorphus]
MTAPHRVPIIRNAHGRATFARGAVRVDRSTRWASPFWIDQPAIINQMTKRLVSDTRANRMKLVTELHFAWLMGLAQVHPAFWCLSPSTVDQLPDPPSLMEVERELRGKVLADWGEIGRPCIGDVLLAIANRTADGKLFPTASDNFKPEVAIRDPRRAHQGGAQLGYAAWGR